MNHNSNLSAIIIKEPQNTLFMSSGKHKPYKFEINIGIIKSQSAPEKETISAEDNFVVKKRKLSESDYKTIQKETSKSHKIVLDTYSKVPMNIIKEGQRLVLDDAKLISTFTSGIIRFAMKEISKEADKIGSEQLQRFKSFALRHFGKVSDSEGMKGIWTVEEFDSEEVVGCKHLFLEYSLKFFSDEKIILTWVDVPEVQNIIRKVYAENRVTFQKYFLGPLLGYADLNQA